MLIPWFSKKEAADTQGELVDNREPLTDVLAAMEADEWEEEEQEQDEIQQRVYEWGMEWSQSPGFAALTQEQKEESEYIVQGFTEYMHTYHDAAPDQWNVQDKRSAIFCFRGVLYGRHRLFSFRLDSSRDGVVIRQIGAYRT